MTESEYIKKEQETLLKLNNWLNSKSKFFPREDGNGNWFEKYNIKEMREWADDGYGNLTPDSALAIKYKNGEVITRMEGESLKGIKWQNIEGMSLDIQGMTTGIYGKVYFRNLWEFKYGEYYFDANVER